MKYVLNGPTIIPMTDDRQILESGAVLVGDDGRIAEVRDEPVDDVPRGAEELDLSGKVVVPGIVNAHTHLYQTLLRATWEDLSLMPWLKRVYGAADVLTPEDCYVGTQLGAAESVQSGVTTILEHQFLTPTYDHATATVDALLDTGVRTVYARTIMDRGDIVPDSVTEDPTAALDDVARLVEQYADEAKLSVRTGPNTPPVNTTTECCEAIAEFCEEHDVGISAHVSESPAVVEQVQEEFGFDGVAEYLDSVGLTGPDCVYAHCVHLNDAEVTLMANTGTAVSHNPVSNMMLGDGVAPLLDLLDQGATVGLGTDGAASNHSQDMVETMKVVSLLHKVDNCDPSVIDPYDVLEMATLGGARALGLDDEVGTVEAGKRADLAVLDLTGHLHNVTVNDVVSQIVHTMKATDVESTMVDGDFLMRDRTLLTVDEDRLRREGQERGQSLHQRASDIDLVD